MAIDDQVARRIYFGMREQGLTTDFHCPFDELPHDYRAQLQAIADSIPFPDPYEQLMEFRARSKQIGHFHAVEVVDYYLEFKGVNGG